MRNNPGVHLVTRSNCAIILLALALAFKASAQAPLPVYNDSEQNGFSDWTWISHSLINTSPVHSGAFSISITATNWSGLYLRHSSFDTSPYASLSFWVNGGARGGQRLQVQAVPEKGAPPANVFYRFTSLPNTWEQITVPLTALNAANLSNCAGFWIQLTAGSPTDTFYVDDIQFDAKPVASAAAMSTNTPVAVTAAGTTARAEGGSWNAVGWFIAGALIVITVLLVWLIVMLRRSGLGTSKALVSMPSSLLQIGPGPDAVAAQGTQALREKMASELTEFAKQSLVQGLYSQRSKLIEAQQKAQQELADLETRLASLHLPLQGRIRAYETRIAELEKALDTRDEEMREMIRATLLLVRERLKNEKAGGYEAPRFN